MALDLAGLVRDLPHRRFRVAEVERMVAHGVIDEDERLELIDGELIEMSPKGAQHESIKRALVRHWLRRMPQDVDLVPETTLRLTPRTFIEPDLVFVPGSAATTQLPRHVLLAVEIADSSLGYDLGRKPAVYATHGIPELWVIDAIRLVLHVFRTPGAAGYADRSSHAAEEGITAQLVPGLQLRHADLDIR